MYGIIGQERVKIEVQDTEIKPYIYSDPYDDEIISKSDLNS